MKETGSASEIRKQQWEHTDAKICQRSRSNWRTIAEKLWSMGSVHVEKKWWESRTGMRSLCRKRLNQVEQWVVKPWEEPIQRWEVDRKWSEGHRYSSKVMEEKGIAWIFETWDVKSIWFLQQYNILCPLCLQVFGTIIVLYSGPIDLFLDIRIVSFLSPFGILA